MSTTRLPAVSQAGMSKRSAAKVMFLLDLADRFEAAGNITESIKSAETALLLRRSLPSSDTSKDTFEVPLAKQAQGLINKCNSEAVHEFQQNNFDASLFLLNKALFLTEANTETNCFESSEHDRLRLRAATYNNLGCLEKRRNNLDAALAYLQKSIEIEIVVDPDVGPTPSTSLNLCTVLNKQGMHLQAVSAAERAITTLKFQAQQGQEHLPQFASMLVMGYYNLGVSLEFSGRPGDVAMAIEAYTNAAETGKRYYVESQNATVENALIAVRRLQASQPSARMAGSRTPTAPQQAMTNTTVARPFGDSPMAYYSLFALLIEILDELA